MTERTVIVLGATGGLGRAVTERFRDDGAAVLAFDARIPAAGDRQDQVTYVAVDALDETSVSAAFAQAPPAAAVVNLIGGYTPPQALSMLDIGVLRQQFELNLVTAAIVTKYAMPMLAARGGGAIVHVSSRVALEKWETTFSYSVAKLGVVRLVEAAPVEGRADGVRVNCILPSIIDTPANRRRCPARSIICGPSLPSLPPCSPSWSRTRPSSSRARPFPSTAARSDGLAARGCPAARPPELRGIPAAGHGGRVRRGSGWRSGTGARGGGRGGGHRRGSWPAGRRGR